MKSRKRELGILLLHGMSPRQQTSLVIAETVLIGLASIIVGILSGLLLTKLLLLISADILGIVKGLPFYFPLEALGLTLISFILLFLFVGVLTTITLRKTTLSELIQAEVKPKPDPKPSWPLSLLALLLIGTGYGFVFYFADKENLSGVFYLILGVVLTVAGTYFLYTQLNIRMIRLFKKRDKTLFNKTNLISISEMAYRVRDNAVMYFLVTIVLAAAFTGLGMCTALGSTGLSEAGNPFAFTYRSLAGNENKQKHIYEIEAKLKEAGLANKRISFQVKYGEQSIILSITDFNQLAVTLGHPAEKLNRDDEVLFVPSWFNELNDAVKNPKDLGTVNLAKSDGSIKEFNVIKKLPYIVTPEGVRGTIYVVPDDFYSQFVGVFDYDNDITTFYVPNWKESVGVAKELDALLNSPEEGYGQTHYFDRPLVLQWLQDKQINGILLIISSLVGLVFFAFAASVLYLRLYTDLERDRQHYRMIAKIGLSPDELKRVVTHQFRFMFFFPFLIAAMHATVAFTAFQQMIYFPFFKEAAAIFASFFAVQVVYFYLARWRYLRQLHL
nr:ABC transporter permease [Paenibacillus pasadenensis]